MKQLQNSYRGLSLVARLNMDWLLSVSMIAFALLLAGFISSV